MRSITLKATLIAVLTSTCLYIPAVQAQPLDKGMPAHEDPSSPLAGMMLPHGEEHTALDIDTLKAQAIELRHSLTDQQRRQIRAVLEANAPSTRGAGAGRGALQGLDQTEQEQIATINAGIRAILTQEQATIFDATLLPPPGEGATSAQQPSDALTNGTSTDCYYAYYYNYNYVYAYAYYAYTYAYYNFVFYSSSDPIASDVYSLAFTLYGSLASSAQLYSNFAYTFGAATYGYSAWRYSTYAQETAYTVYYLALRLSYTWVPNAYAYYSQYYAYYSWYYAYYFANVYAYNCAH
jgi:hypothetical protein